MQIYPTKLESRPRGFYEDRMMLIKMSMRSGISHLVFITNAGAFLFQLRGRRMLWK